MPRIVLLGPPGSGKGTQSRIIKADFDIPVIATGDILRQNVEDHTACGNDAQSYIAAGELVPDELVIDLIKAQMAKEDISNGWLLDGFPRTVEQAKALDEILEKHGKTLDGVFFLRVPKDILINRIAGRRVCSLCGRVYHIDTLQPKTEGICDCDGADLVWRNDDDPKTVQNRIDVYDEQTRPLVDYYSEKGLLTIIDGTISIDEIEQKIRDTVE